MNGSVESVTWTVRFNILGDSHFIAAGPEESSHRQVVQ